MNAIIGRKDGPFETENLSVACAAFADGEILHELATGRLFRLNRTAAQIWRHLRSATDVEVIVGQLAQDYRLDLATARRDVQALIGGLQRTGILAAAKPSTQRVWRVGLQEPRSKPAWSAVCRVGEVPVRVVCHSAAVAESLALLTERAVIRGSADNAAETSLALFRRGGSFVLMYQGQPICCTTNAASARWSLLRQLVMFGRRRRWLALLHAAGASTPAGCFLLAGGSGSGKSTLLAGLLHAGCGFVADDIVPLEAGSQTVWPVPLAMSIKSGSWSVVQERFPELQQAPAIRFAGRQLRYLWPGSGTTAMAAGSRTAAVLFPRFTEGAATTLTQVDPLRALFLLAAEGSLLPSTDAGLAEFLDWLTQLPAFELVYGHLEEAVVRTLALAAELHDRGQLEVSRSDVADSWLSVHGDAGR